MCDQLRYPLLLSSYLIYIQVENFETTGKKDKGKQKIHFFKRECTINLFSKDHWRLGLPGCKTA